MTGGGHHGGAVRPGAAVVWALAGAGWAAWWARLGPGMTADTMDYLGIGRPVFTLHPDAFQWPPAFWLLLQTGRALGLTPWLAATVVLCGARALLSAGAYRLGRRLAGPRGGHGLALFTFLWVPLTYASLYALSETLFLGALVWWLAAAHAVHPAAPDLEPRVWRTTAWATLLASTRFLGAPLAFVEWWFASVTLRAAGRPGWKRTSSLTGACIVGPQFLWALLGGLVSGEVVGERRPSLAPLSVHLSLVGTGWWEPLVRGRYGDIFWGDRGGLHAPAPLMQAFLYACALILTWVMLQPRRGGAPVWRSRLVAAIGLYLFALITSSARIWLDPIGPRFLLPVVLLAVAGGCHPIKDLHLGRWSAIGSVVLLGAWLTDGVLAGRLAPRFGTDLLAVIGFGGAALCLGAAWLEPRAPARRLGVRVVVRILVAVVLIPQGLWSAQLLHRVADGALPSIQHPGWRLEPGVRALRAAMQPGDIIYTHTEDAVRAVLNDRSDIRVEPFCFRLLSPDCPESLAEYVAALDARERTGAEWIVLCDRVFLPYLFMDELRGLVSQRPWVERVEAGSVSAYRWPPTGRAPGAPDSARGGPPEAMVGQ